VLQLPSYIQLLSASSSYLTAVLVAGGVGDIEDIPLDAGTGSCSSGTCSLSLSLSLSRQCLFLHFFCPTNSVSLVPLLLSLTQALILCRVPMLQLPAYIQLLSASSSYLAAVLVVDGVGDIEEIPLDVGTGSCSSGTCFLSLSLP
jgi:hypothetical protein